MKITILKHRELSEESGISTQTLTRIVNETKNFPRFKINNTIRYVRELARPIIEVKKNYDYLKNDSMLGTTSIILNTDQELKRYRLSFI